jgi:hypothetical protein
MKVQRTVAFRKITSLSISICENQGEDVHVIHVGKKPMKDIRGC